MKGIQFKNISKSYDGKTKIIKDFNLDINEGEFLVLLGPSGCGKSTLLRILAGLEEIDSGEIYIDGELVNDKEPKDRNIAMVFQNYALYPHMTVYKNIGISLMLKKEAKEEIDKRVKEVASMLDIEELLDRKPKQLSGGQMQRVALARAMVRNPKVFLMDEPLSNLDSKLRIQTRAEIMKLYRTLGVTTIYVTHDQVEAMTMATRIVLMDKGEIKQMGTPDELYNRPANKFVASFIGSPQMNFIKDEEGREIGIRAEHLGLLEGDEYIVDLVENLGSEKLVYLESKKDKGVNVAVRTEADFKVEIGDRFNLDINKDKVHRFDN